MRLQSLAAAAAALALGGCLSLGGGGDPPAQLFTLAAYAAAPAAARTASAEQAVTVLTPSVPESLQVRRVPVYVSPTSVQYLTEAQWIDYPAELFRNVLSETVAAETGRVVLDPRQFARDPGLQVAGQLGTFGLDPGRMEAVAIYDATIDRADGGVATRRFEARVPVGSVEPAAVIPALNEAANRIAGEVAAWIAG